MEIDLRALSDDEVRSRLRRLVVTERAASVAMVLHLAEYDARKLYVGEGFRNLWQYCESLGLAEAEIRLRIQTARAIHGNPELRRALERGETSISAIGRLAPHLTEENKTALLEEVRGKSRREVERVVAREAVAARVLQERRTEAAEEAAAPTLFVPRADAVERPAPPSAEECARFVRRENPDESRRVSGEDWRLAFVVDGGFMTRLETLRTLLAGRFPEARLEDVLGAAMELVLERIEPRRRENRRAARRGAPVSALRRRPIPRRLREAVLARDGHRCTFEGAAGRCPETRRLELDHVVPRALGGPDTFDNLRAVCRTHNRFLAEMAFGAAFIAAAIARRRAAEEAPAGGDAADISCRPDDLVCQRAGP